MSAPASVPPGRDTSQQLQRDLENRVITLEAQLRAATSQLDARSVDDQNTALALAAAESELIGLRGSVDRLERETANLRSEVQTLGAERDEARADAAEYERDHAALVVDHDAAARRLETLTLEVQELSASRDAALTEAAALRSQQARQQERLDAVDRGRADLEAELADVSSKWQRLQAGAADLTQRNAALEADLDQLRRIRESAELERRGLFEDLAVQLGRVEAERDLLASQLELANSRLRGTRQAFESAARTVNDELDSCEGAFGETELAAEAMHAAVSETVRRLDLLGEVIETSSRPQGVSDDEVTAGNGFTSSQPLSAPASARSGEPANVATPAVSALADVAAPEVLTVDASATDSDPSETALAEEVAEEVVADEEGSDLADVLASYGLGAGPPEDTEPAVFEPAVFEPAVFERNDVERRDVEPDSPGATHMASAVEPEVERGSADDATPQRASVPAIAGDPLTIARHTVTTAEVVLLIDGDPVAAMGWPMLGPVERRDALVGNLGDLVGDTGAAADVVFDGNVAGDEQLPSAPAVRVRLTSADVDPSEAIGGLLDAYPLQWPIAVVTDDPHLAQAARDLGASVLDNGQLLDLFITP